MRFDENKFTVDLPTIRMAKELGMSDEEILRIFPELSNPRFVKTK
ncbi:MAG: hypothetical protein QG589_82 [Patescibacteria group bacterium]|jgi:hypothetical protein|nr:hypothetical protein [Patescibacteria group bacterium]